jgi:hypothetical protein
MISKSPPDKFEYKNAIEYMPERDLGLYAKD